MKNFTKIEKIIYEGAIRKKSPFYFWLVNGICVVLLVLVPLFLYLAFKLQRTDILDKAVLFLLVAFFVRILLIYQSIIRKLNGA
ncbi:MAG: hypothetical protein COV74_04035 [Candidatus Omnitrophica bacterium CG11_big_fil_rev_8_21_14_0_20_45_26]|uniref:Uncharacterized protein n=1 Tax=Candidatus Abzuiibacterium crystallinum TaxID=1974748 RepID=A0A2H0LS99_9BACT|nr:MAG: hypothetical protein COV74_04035 [Candidatus Omnitrophica bacterium CG11_big_fil_rev_8_21_14_0_20_45_26]PIW65286.1 MAG: hypothetical protein COW12_02815 [Candidatus Omnitrophica bacterium CG12_big_fil_rev_8_21_14_0_65_45_16]